jgi:PDZ domain
MTGSPPARRRRWLLLPAGALLGAAAAFLSPGTSGCVYHDTCIMVTSPGRDWCRNVANALMWPVDGSIADAEPILRPDGATPRGCHCYNDAEEQILRDHAPECRFEDMFEELGLAARQECQALVPPGYDHNCWTSTGTAASVVEGEFRGGVGSCIGNCEYGAPPADGSCPTPDPYECATGGGEECDTEGDAEATGGESGVDETGSDESGMGAIDIDALDIDAFVSCEGRACEVDEALARRLYADPSSLVGQRTRLVHDGELRRHVFAHVEPGTLAYVLGLRTGDRLESVNGLVIHDLGAALDAYVRLGEATELEVKIKRGSQWLDFTYTFVR